MTTYDPTPSVEQIAEWTAVLRGLFPDGYSDDPDGLREKELSSAAYVFAWCHNVLTNTGVELYPHLASELLDEHEAEYLLPNDAGITDADRRKRLVAIRAIRGMNNASIGRVFAALGGTGAIEYRGVTESEMALEANLDTWHALACVIKVTEAEYLVSRIRQALSLAIDRASDVSRLGIDHVSGGRLLATAIGAVWTATTADDGLPQRFGRVAIDRASSVSADIDSPWTDRIRSFGPLSVLHMDDMRRVIRGTAMVPGAGVLAQAPAMAGDLKCFAAVSIPAGTNVLIESGRDWKDRLVLVSGFASTAADVRPGGAAEDGDANRFGPFVLLSSTGGVGNVRNLIANVDVYADAATGLRIRNTGGTTAYVAIFAWASSQITSGAANRRDAFNLADPYIDSMNHATFNTFAVPLETEHGGASDLWNVGEVRGVIHRTALVPPFKLPSSATPVEYVIDSSIDWRDRLIVCSFGSWDDLGRTTIPGGYDQDLGVALDDNAIANACPTLVFGYTGAGHAAAQAAPGQWDISGGLTAPVHLYANSTTGALTLACYQFAGPPGYPTTPLVTLIGSFQLGVKVTGPQAPIIPLAVSGDPMRPAQLNRIQDYAVQGYGRAVDGSSTDLATIPLGLDVYGAPPLARVDVAQRDRLTGFAQDAAVPLVRRERTEGGATCFDDATYAVGDNLVDSSQDWRDRWISCVDAATTGSAQTRGFYSGPGTTAAVLGGAPARAYAGRIHSGPIYLYADATTGALRAYNASAGAVVVRSFIVGSPCLGARSVFVSGRRSERAPLSLTGIYLWLTADRCNIVAGRVANAPGGSRIFQADQFNGFQSSGASAVGFAAATPAGATWPWLGGTPDYPHTKLRSVKAGPAQYLASSWSAGTYNFLHQGPCTAAFGFRALNDLPWTTEASLYNPPGTGLYFPVFGPLFTDVGAVFAIQRGSGYPVWIHSNGVVIYVYIAPVNVIDGKPHVFSIRQAASPAPIDIYLDGKQVATAATVAIAAPAVAAYRLAATAENQVTPDGYVSAAVDMGEIILVNGALSDTQLRQLHSYMLREHGVTT